ncbi:carbonic anhydrase family protein [Acidobacteria bacterium AB60]|nr:carbonic anhydrase family protein [Acidobacteria bacterium AB60]
MRILAGVGVWLGLIAAAGAQGAVPWSYLGNTGPLNWGKLSPAYKTCSQGHEQAPIDIRGAHLNKSLAPLEFHYISAGVTLENTGNLIVMHPNPGSSMTVDGVKYELQELTFHRPSESAVGGKLTDLDVEMLHKSADGKMAILEVRFTMNRDQPNAVLAALWPHLPTKAGATEKVTEYVNAGGLLPADRGYWTFMGSLTTPPCTEGVRWFVMEQTLTLSREQVRQFAGMFRMSSRPLQDTHGRKIEANE